MSSTSSQELADSVSDLNEQECEQSHSARSSLTLGASSPSIGQPSTAMTTLEPSPPLASQQTEFPWMSSAEDFRARTSVRLEPALEFLALGVVSGESMPDWFANYDRATSSWKTAQTCLDAGLETFSGTWPIAGMTRNGQSFRLAEWAPHIHATDCFLWHTPTANDKKPAGQKEMEMVRRHMAGASVPNTYIRLRSQLAARSGLRLPANPLWIEWLMGFPAEWTDCGASAIRSSRKSRKSSGERS
jgi:hypothetical protein